jgi:hypothetical protein
VSLVTQTCKAGVSEVETRSTISVAIVQLALMRLMMIIIESFARALDIEKVVATLRFGTVEDA